MSKGEIIQVPLATTWTAAARTSGVLEVESSILTTTDPPISPVPLTCKAETLLWLMKIPETGLVIATKVLVSLIRVTGVLLA